MIKVLLLTLGLLTTAQAKVADVKYTVADEKGFNANYYSVVEFTPKANSNVVCVVMVHYRSGGLSCFKKEKEDD